MKIIICRSTSYLNNLTIRLVGRFKLFQETDVVLEIEPEVAHLVFEHCDALNAHTEGETGIFLAVDAAVFQHVGVNHSTAQNLEPAGALADVAALAAAD